METLSALLAIVLFLVTVVWVGKKPTFKKTAAMIAVVAAVQGGADSISLFMAGTNIYDWYLQSLNAVADTYSQTLGLASAQTAALRENMQIVAGCLPALYVLQAAGYVFIALGIVWAFRRLTKRPLGWAAFSTIDLPIWTVVPLIAAAFCYAASNAPGVPYAHELLLVTVNFLLVGMLFPVVQGMAACKGIMNRIGFSSTAQVFVTLIGFVVGVAVLVIPIVGLIDYWANFRKLAR